VGDQREFQGGQIRFVGEYFALALCAFLADFRLVGLLGGDPLLLRPLGFGLLRFVIGSRL
jgi:hypothetical protein